MTVVFHLRDLPETLRFNHTEHGQGTMEYEWEVAIDADNDRSTGPGGFDTLLSAYHIAFLSHKGVDADTNAPIGEMLEAKVWETGADGSTSTLADADLAVSAEENTITISGYIPGITSESRLTFSAFDVEFAGEADQIACHDPYSKSVEPRGCDSGKVLIRPGQTATDEIEGATASYVDIAKVSTTLSGETLTVTFHLRDVPETLTFDRTGVPEHALEYNWAVSIDVDNDPETGAGGFDYVLSAGYFVHPLAKDSNTVAKIAEPGFVTAGILGLDGEGNRVLAEADIEVSAEENTITLSGEIPGITEESPLYFKAFDYFDGSVEMSSAVPSIADLAADTCRSDSAAIRPGQQVIDAVSDALPAYIDIT